MRRRLPLATLAALLGLAALVPLAPPAYAELTGFQTPSKNIHCLYQNEFGTPSVRCDILNFTGPIPRRPASCDLDYGRAFEVTTTGRAARACVGDTVADPANRVLAYGRTFTRPGITCTSDTKGVTCTNRLGRGFFVSRANARTF